MATRCSGVSVRVFSWRFKIASRILIVSSSTLDDSDSGIALELTVSLPFTPFPGDALSARWRAALLLFDLCPLETGARPFGLFITSS